MNDEPPSESSGGVAGALGTLRHALADPLSAAGLRLELVERLLADGRSLPSSLVAPVRGAKADVAAAGRLVDLLPRLARLSSEAPVEVALEDVCRAAGVPIGQEPALPRIRLRRLASVDALRALAELCRSPGPGAPPPSVRADAGPVRVTLRIEGDGGRGLAEAERLLRLPRGEEAAEELFLARACIESDGGRVDLEARDGRLVALASWPRPLPPPGARGPA